MGTKNYKLKANGQFSSSTHFLAIESERGDRIGRVNWHRLVLVAKVLRNGFSGRRVTRPRTLLWRPTNLHRFTLR